MLLFYCYLLLEAQNQHWHSIHINNSYTEMTHVNVLGNVPECVKSKTKDLKAENTIKN
jgi:hypothetical protein